MLVKLNTDAQEDLKLLADLDQQGSTLLMNIFFIKKYFFICYNTNIFFLSYFT